eukprot:153055-Pyramimonas_sp.AAC.2
MLNYRVLLSSQRSKCSHAREAQTTYTYTVEVTQCAAHLHCTHEWARVCAPLTAFQAFHFALPLGSKKPGWPVNSTMHNAQRFRR